MALKKIKTARTVSFGGVLAAVAVLFQSAPVFLPAVGMLLSPLSTLPVALAAFLGLAPGMAVLFSAALILLMISPQEAVILLLTTGPLGIALGWSLSRKSFITAVLISATALFTGMVVLTCMVGIAAFGGLTNSFSWGETLLIFLDFALVYAALWAAALKRLMRHPYFTGLFRTFFEDAEE